MKQKESSLKRQSYQPPRADILHLETQTVLCGSGMRGNSTEKVGISSFDWI